MGDAAVANMPPPRPQQHYQEPPQASPQFVGMSSNDVASKVVDAYKTSPLLTGLLLLNLIIFVGAGYYLNVVQDRSRIIRNTRPRRNTRNIRDRFSLFRRANLLKARLRPCHLGKRLAQ